MVVPRDTEDIAAFGGSVFTLPRASEDALDADARTSQIDAGFEFPKERVHFDELFDRLKELHAKAEFEAKEEGQCHALACATLPLCPPFSRVGCAHVLASGGIASSHPFPRAGACVGTRC